MTQLYPSSFTTSVPPLKIKMEDFTNTESKPQDTVVVVMVPLPAQGHLNQLLHLSHLISSYGLPVHYVGSSSHNRQAKLRLNGWGSETQTRIHFHDFQLPEYDSPLPKPDPQNPFPTHLYPLFQAATHFRDPVSQLLHQLSEKFGRVVVIHDIGMTSVVQDVKLISNGESYNFMPVSCFTFFCNYWETLSEEAEKPFKVDFNDIPENLPSVNGTIPPEILDFVRKQSECLGFESGWIYNTSRIIEGKYVELMEKASNKKRQMKHFALGPFNPTSVKSEMNEKRHECLKWLDEQEEGSVIYVSFGSTTSLTDEQIEELADGLEKCGVKFIWVLRRADPNDVFAEADKVTRPQLFEGYEERIKDRGIVVRDWAPQLEILAHPSVGGFMSHCGWNSCLESISMGVPIVAWPMHSDQPRNAFLVTQVLRIGVLVRDWERRCEIVRSNCIENVVKKLMVFDEGKEIRKRAKELGEAVRGSVDEGGVSRLERDSFIAYISR